MNDLIVVLLIIFITAIGSILCVLIRKRSEKSFLTTIGYGLGVGAITFQLYLYSRLHIMWNVTYICIPWIILLVYFVFSYRDKLRLPHIKFPTISLFAKVLLFAIGITVLYVLFESVLRPTSVWDSWAIWLARAKVFFIDGSIRPAMLNYEHTNYPVVVSLLGTFVYIFLGRVDDTAVLLVFFGYYLFLAILFYATLRKRFSMSYSLLFTFLLVTLQTLIRQGGRLEAGQADLALGYYGFIDYILCMDYIKNKDARTLLLLSLFLGITSMVKYDGVPLALIIAIFAGIFILRNKLYKHFVVLAIWLLPSIDWQLFLKIYHIGYGLHSEHPFSFSSQKTLNVFKGVCAELFNIKSWNMLWITYIYSLFLINKKYNYEIVLLHVVIVSQLIVYTFLYLTTAGYDPGSSMERLLVHIAPLALYAIALTLHRFKKQYVTIKL